VTSLSVRSGLVRPQPMFEILSEANRLQRSGRRIIRLEIGDTSENADRLLVEKLNRVAFSNEVLGYSPSAGEFELRGAFAKVQSDWKKHVFREENIVVTPANAAVSQLFHLLADAGDTVIMPDPCFPTYRLAAEFADLRVANFTLSEGAHFSPNLDEILQVIRRSVRPKILIIDSPSNPLGISHPREFMQGLGQMCLESGVNLVVDETYRNLTYSSSPVPEYVIEGATYIYSLSKDAGAPGLRLGFVTGSESLAAKVADYNSLFYSCLPKSLQLAAQSFLEDESRSYTQAVSIYEARAKEVSEIFSNARSISFVKPNASIYFFLNVSETGLTGQEFAFELLNQKSVCVCPGIGFGPAGDRYVRISIAGDRDELQVGCERILDFADHLVSRRTLSKASIEPN